MRWFVFRVAVIVAVLLLMMPYSYSAEEKKGDPSGKRVVKDDGGNVKAPPLFAYKPPIRGKPGNRVGGGTRGGDRDYPSIVAVVPDHTGFTVSGQPVLSWYLSGPTKHEIEFTIIDETSIEPIAEITLPGENTKGFHVVRLAEVGVTLRSGIDYQWFVSIVRDREQRSKDIIATGFIRRVDASEELVRELSSLPRTDMPSVYARHGIWYDMLASLDELISSAPGDAELRGMKEAVIEQVGLSAAVAE